MKFFKLGLVSALLVGCQAIPMQKLALPSPIAIQSDAGLNHVSGRFINSLFANYDQNQDGLLDKDEVKIPLLVRLLDKNGDKALSPEELHSEKAIAIIVKLIRTTSKPIFKLADRDDNGFLNYQEFVIANQLDNKVVQLYFRLSDNDFDSQINPSEFEDFLGEALVIAGKGLNGFPFSSAIFRQAAELPS